MKQLARLTTLLMLLLVGAGFTSCGDDDDEEGSSNSAIVGTWRCEGDYSGGYDQLTFNANGTGIYVIVGYNSWNGEEYREEQKFTYTYTDGILTIKFESGETQSIKVTISGDRLTPEGEEDGEAFDKVYVRVS